MTTRLSYGHVAGLVAACVLFVFGVSPIVAAGARKTATHTVTIDATRYQPAVVTIRAGDSIVWVNKDLFPHTVTSRAGGFDSQVIPAGQSWTYTPKAKGESAYACIFHSTMTGTLRVR